LESCQQGELILGICLCHLLYKYLYALIYIPQLSDTGNVQPDGQWGRKRVKTSAGKEPKISLMTRANLLYPFLTFCLYIFFVNRLAIKLNL
jgi:hypothetical protein